MFIYVSYVCMQSFSLAIINLGACLIILGCMCYLMHVLLLTRLANRSNQFATSVRLV
jgi:hypothetical protein